MHLCNLRHFAPDNRAPHPVTDTVKPERRRRPLTADGRRRGRACRGADMVVELQRHQAVEVGFERAPFCVISLRHGGPTGETSRMVEPATDIPNRKCGATTNPILIEIETIAADRIGYTLPTGAPCKDLNKADDDDG